MHRGALNGIGIGYIKYFTRLQYSWIESFGAEKQKYFNIDFNICQFPEQFLAVKNLAPSKCQYLLFSKHVDGCKIACMTHLCKYNKHFSLTILLVNAFISARSFGKIAELLISPSLICLTRASRRVSIYFCLKNSYFFNLSYFNLFLNINDK